jgi:hypothetical protein
MAQQNDWLRDGRGSLPDSSHETLFASTVRPAPRQTQGPLKRRTEAVVSVIRRQKRKIEFISVQTIALWRKEFQFHIHKNVHSAGRIAIIGTINY